MQDAEEVLNVETLTGDFEIPRNAPGNLFNFFSNMINSGLDLNNGRNVPFYIGASRDTLGYLCGHSEEIGVDGIFQALQLVRENIIPFSMYASMEGMDPGTRDSCAYIMARLLVKFYPDAEYKGIHYMSVFTHLDSSFIQETVSEQTGKVKQAVDQMVIIGGLKSNIIRGQPIDGLLNRLHFVDIPVIDILGIVECAANHQMWADWASIVRAIQTISGSMPVEKLEKLGNELMESIHRTYDVNIKFGMMDLLWFFPGSSKMVDSYLDEAYDKALNENDWDMYNEINKRILVSINDENLVLPSVNVKMSPNQRVKMLKMKIVYKIINPQQYDTRFESNINELKLIAGKDIKFMSTCINICINRDRFDYWQTLWSAAAFYDYDDERTQQLLVLIMDTSIKKDLLDLGEKHTMSYFLKTMSNAEDAICKWLINCIQIERQGIYEAIISHVSIHNRFTASFQYKLQSVYDILNKKIEDVAMEYHDNPNESIANRFRMLWKMRRELLAKFNSDTNSYILEIFYRQVAELIERSSYYREDSEFPGMVIWYAEKTVGLRSKKIFELFPEEISDRIIKTAYLEMDLPKVMLLLKNGCEIDPYWFCTRLRKHQVMQDVEIATKYEDDQEKNIKMLQFYHNALTAYAHNFGTWATTKNSEDTETAVENRLMAFKSSMYLLQGYYLLRCFGHFDDLDEKLSAGYPVEFNRRMVTKRREGRRKTLVEIAHHLMVDTNSKREPSSPYSFISMDHQDSKTPNFRYHDKIMRRIREGLLRFTFNFRLADAYKTIPEYEAHINIMKDKLDVDYMAELASFLEVNVSVNRALLYKSTIANLENSGTPRQLHLPIILAIQFSRNDCDSNHKIASLGLAEIIKFGASLYNIGKICSSIDNIPKRLECGYIPDGYICQQKYIVPLMRNLRESGLGKSIKLLLDRGYAHGYIYFLSMLADHEYGFLKFVLHRADLNLPRYSHNPTLEKNSRLIRGDAYLDADFTKLNFDGEIEHVHKFVKGERGIGFLRHLAADITSTYFCTALDLGYDREFYENTMDHLSLLTRRFDGRVIEWVSYRSRYDSVPENDIIRCLQERSEVLGRYYNTGRNLGEDQNWNESQEQKWKKNFFLRVPFYNINKRKIEYQALRSTASIE